MGKFFRFERMITPVIIQIIFWAGLIAAIIFGALLIFAGLGSDDLSGVFMGLLIILFGPIGVRIYCEILIIFFKILGILVDIRDKLDDNGGGLTPSPEPTPTPSPTSGHAGHQMSVQPQARPQQRAPQQRPPQQRTTQQRPPQARPQQRAPQQRPPKQSADKKDERDDTEGLF